MSSDPIEVLREAVTALKTMHGPFDHDYIKDEKCCDRCRLLVRAESALASLSAPKPESAEAVGTISQSHPMMGSGFMHAFICKTRLPDGTKVYTAPPRPEASEGWHAALDSASELVSNAPGFRYRRRAEQVRDWIKAHPAAPQQASAPVGVEAIADKIENDRTYWRSEAVADLRALAQQPAAVDARILELADRLVAPGPKAAHVSASECHELRNFIHALAGQQQGGES